MISLGSTAANILLGRCCCQHPSHQPSPLAVPWPASTTVVTFVGRPKHPWQPRCLSIPSISPTFTASPAVFTAVVRHNHLYQRQQPSSAPSLSLGDVRPPCYLICFQQPLLHIDTMSSVPRLDARIGRIPDDRTACPHPKKGFMGLSVLVLHSLTNVMRAPRLSQSDGLASMIENIGFPRDHTAPQSHLGNI